MLFQGVPEVDFGNELAQFSSLAKNNEYFRINVEKDKALVTQQLKRAYEGKGQNIHFGILSSVGQISFGQLYLDSCICYLIRLAIEWVQGCQDAIQKYQ